MVERISERVLRPKFQTDLAQLCPGILVRALLHSGHTPSPHGMIRAGQSHWCIQLRAPDCSLCARHASRCWSNSGDHHRDTSLGEFPFC